MGEKSLNEKLTPVWNHEQQSNIQFSSHTEIFDCAVL